MSNKYTLEIGFLALVIVLSLVGFSSLAVGEHAGLTPYQGMHIVISLAWLGLLLRQLMLIRQKQFHRHRSIGTSIFVAGPVLLASLTLMTVHSAAREAAAGKTDTLVVQNVMFTVQVALLVFLAFALRHNRKVHGSLLLSTALMFMVIAMFFTFISYVPGYRIEGPETFDRFEKAGQMSALIGALVGLLFFLRNWRTGWPWLLTGSFFFLDGYLQMVVAQADRTKSLTVQVGSIGRAPAFALGLLVFGALLWLAWRVQPNKPKKGELIATLPAH